MSCRRADAVPATVQSIVVPRTPMVLHPAVWLAAWCAAAIAVQRLGLHWLAVASAPTFLFVALHAGHDAWRLLKRARWLLLAIAVLFVAATPGERLPGALGAAGVSVEGLQLAGEHLLRLALLLSTLASLLRLLGRDGLLGGLHCLLAPLGILRERIVVRLMLTLDYVEDERKAARWRDWLADVPETAGSSLHLAVAPLRAMDRLLIGGVLAGATGLMLL